MTEEWKDNVASIYLNNLVKSGKISKAFGSSFVAFFQPLIYYKNHLTEEEKPFYLDQEKNYYIDIRERIISRIDQITKESDVQIIDLSDIYQDRSDWVFSDIVHTRQAAKNSVAGAMFHHLHSLSLIPGIERSSEPR